MIKKFDSNKARAKRHARVRAKISGTPDCPRLNVYRSTKHIYAQIIDDVNGVTLASASCRRRTQGWRTDRKACFGKEHHRCCFR